MLYDTPIVHRAKNVHVAIAAGEKVHIINHNESPIQLDACQKVWSWFKGKWWQEKSGDIAANSDVKFEITGPDVMVFVGGKYTSVRDAILERRKTKPADSDLCYHDVIDKPLPGDPLAFEVRLKHSVIFRGSNSPAKETEAKDESQDGPNRKALSPQSSDV